MAKSRRKSQFRIAHAARLCSATDFEHVLPRRLSPRRRQFGTDVDDVSQSLLCAFLSACQPADARAESSHALLQIVTRLCAPLTLRNRRRRRDVSV